MTCWILRYWKRDSKGNPICFREDYSDKRLGKFRYLLARVSLKKYDVTLHETEL